MNCMSWQTQNFQSIFELFALVSNEQTVHNVHSIAGLLPRRIRELSDKYNITVPKSTFLPPEKQQNVRTLLKEYFSSLCKHLLKDHNEMQEFEKQNRRILQTKGELSNERKEKLESMQISYEKLLSATQSFADTLDEAMPTLKVDVSTKEDDIMMVMGTRIDFEETVSNVDNIWCDIETQRFYRDLPELQAFLPNALIPKNQISPIAESTVTEEVLDSDLPSEELEDDGKYFYSNGAT